jgi:hypothetical protein
MSYAGHEHLFYEFDPPAAGLGLKMRGIILPEEL